MDINQTLQNLRVHYLMASLDVKDCDPHPELQFNKWFKEAVASEVDEPNAFVLSTAFEGKPKARVLLLKGIENNQFVFYTNYKSAKGLEIEHNSHVALTFLWLPLHRQVRIEGIASKVDTSVSEAYFKVRPRGSQVGAWASPQSQKVADRAHLEELFKKAENKFQDGIDIPRPAHWGGYAITPTSFEFWQGRDNRMHDRIFYEYKNNEWTLGRLAP